MLAILNQTVQSLQDQISKINDNHESTVNMMQDQINTQNSKLEELETEIELLTKRVKTYK